MSQLTKAWRSSRLYARLRTRRLPKLLVIGAQKGGTSALFAYLAQHPRLAPSLYKELSFFGSDLRFGYGLDWYANQWDPQTPGRSIRFDASPQYLSAAKAAGRIRQCLPNVRLVAALRDPIRRAYSAWRMYRQQLAEDPHFYHNLVRTFYSPAEQELCEPRTDAEVEDFELAIVREIDAIERGRFKEWSVVKLGLYGPMLARYFDLFPRQQLLVIDSQSLRTNRVLVLNQILQFIGLPKWDWSNADLRDVFVGNSSGPIPGRASDILREYYRDSNRQLVELLDDPPAFVHDDVALRRSA